MYTTDTGTHCTLRQRRSDLRPALAGTLWATGYRVLCFVTSAGDGWDATARCSWQWLRELRGRDLDDLGFIVPAAGRACIARCGRHTLGEAVHGALGANWTLAELEASEWSWVAAVLDRRSLLRAHNEMWSADLTAETTTFTWLLQLEHDAQVIVKHWTGACLEASPPVETAAELDWHRTRVAVAQRPGRLLPHPLTSRVAWPRPTPLPTMRFTRQTLLLQERKRGQTDLLERRTRASAATTAFVAATACIPAAHWLTVFSVLGPSEREFWQRLCCQALRMWTTEDGLRCAVDGCDEGQVTVAHVLWGCQMARAVWTRMLHDWGGQPDERWLRYVMSGTLTEPPADFWQLLLDQDDRAPDAAHPSHQQRPTIANGEAGLHAAVASTWLAHVTHTLRGLWRWRFTAAAARPTIAGVYFAAHTTATRRLRVYTTALRLGGGPAKADEACCLRVVTTAFARRQLPRPPLAAGLDSTWLLFFDGGSRGNPGAGGAGSVLVQVTATGARVVWGCATYLPARTTTNNVAELRGLLDGLRQAWRQGITCIEVIGDSALILRWMRARRPPKQEPLRRGYHCARHFADRLQVTGWSHHYRTANRMADRLANVAMDAQASCSLRACADPNYQLRRPLHEELTRFLPLDIAPWETRRTVAALPP